MKDMNGLKRKTLLLVASGAIALGLGATPSFADAQPNMRKALENLKSAEVLLLRATRDKGGHRVRAMRLVREAIEEVQKGIQYDNNH